VSNLCFVERSVLKDIYLNIGMFSVGYIE